jgi:hypothetical protein
MVLDSIDGRESDCCYCMSDGREMAAAVGLDDYG